MARMAWRGWHGEALGGPHLSIGSISAKISSPRASVSGLSRWVAGTSCTAKSTAPPSSSSAASARSSASPTLRLQGQAQRDWEVWRGGQRGQPSNRETALNARHGDRHWGVLRHHRLQCRTCWPHRHLQARRPRARAICPTPTQPAGAWSGRQCLHAQHRPQRVPLSLLRLRPHALGNDRVIHGVGLAAVLSHTQSA